VVRVSVPKGVLVVAGKPYRVKLFYDPYNKVWEAKLSLTQMRSVLEHVEKHGGWLISHKWVYDPNYDGIRAPTASEKAWRPLTPDGLRFIINNDLRRGRGVHCYYLPSKNVFEIYFTYGKTYYLRPARKNVKINLKQ